MIFQRIIKSDLETLKCFLPYRKIFVYSSKSAIKQLTRIIKTSKHFYKVYDNSVFIGCLFVDDIDHENKIIEFGGFSFRHVNTRQAIRELVAYLKHYYPNYRIKAVTSQKTAKISLSRAGFTFQNGGYIYNEQK